MSEEMDRLLLLAVTRLTKHFSSALNNRRPSLTAFHDLSFELDGGQMLGLIGSSGAGKSSILKCINRTYIPSSGDVWFVSVAEGRINLTTAGDQQVLRMRRREIGYASQFLHVIPRISALDVVADPLIHRGVSHADAHKAAAEWLTRLHIPERLWSAYPSTFSGGEQQRVNLARTFIGSPRLLLLDEPTASLDAATASLVVAVLRELKDQGVGIIGVFHDQTLLRRVADEVLEIAQFDLPIREEEGVWTSVSP